MQVTTIGLVDSAEGDFYLDLFLRRPESIDNGSIVPLRRIVGDGAGISVQKKFGYQPVARGHVCCVER